MRYYTQLPNEYITEYVFESWLLIVFYKKDIPAIREILIEPTLINPMRPTSTPST